MSSRTVSSGGSGAAGRREVSQLKEEMERSLVSDAIDYMRLHFAEPLKLEKVARHVGCSACYLSRRFQAERVCTFTYYLNRLRIEQSKLLLLNQSLTIADVGYMVGFSEQGYFIKVFRKYVEITPKQYQRFIKHSFLP